MAPDLRKSVCTGSVQGTVAYRLPLVPYSDRCGYKTVSLAYTARKLQAGKIRGPYLSPSALKRAEVLDFNAGMG